MAAQQVTAITDSKLLETLPLSQLSVDDSGPPQVNYGADNRLAASTPRTSLVSHPSTTNIEHDREIIPGISNRLYPSFATEGDIYMCSPGEHETMANTVTDKLDKYLQQAAQKQKVEANYFENTNKQSSSLPKKLKVFQHINTEVPKPNDKPPKTLPESFAEDTSDSEHNHVNYIEDNLPTIPKEEQEEDQPYNDTLTFNEDQEHSDNEH